MTEQTTQQIEALAALVAEFAAIGGDFGDRDLDRELADYLAEREAA